MWRWHLAEALKALYDAPGLQGHRGQERNVKEGSLATLRQTWRGKLAGWLFVAGFLGGVGGIIGAIAGAGLHVLAFGGICLCGALWASCREEAAQHRALFPETRLSTSEELMGVAVFCAWGGWLPALLGYWHLLAVCGICFCAAVFTAARDWHRQEADWAEELAALDAARHPLRRIVAAEREVHARRHTPPRGASKAP